MLCTFLVYWSHTSDFL